MVRAYWLAVQKGESGEAYNICSENVILIKKLLDKLLKISQKDIAVKQDLKRLRPSGVPLSKGDCSKFKRRTGWEPKIALKKTLENTLKYWRDKL
jgi:GDP-4-dehydro-6-deoxy-D-mannose reductase